MSDSKLCLSGKIMLSEPFNILREKVPFLEYSIRSLLLFLKPQIETQEQLKSGRMKYALWDIFLSVSLFTTVVGVLNVYNQKVDLATSLTAFSSQFVLLVEFGYYAYFSTFSFFIIVCIFMFILKPADVHPFKGAYLASLHYARCYALFLFLFLPLLVLYINALFTELVTIDEFFNKAGPIGWLILGGFLGLYIWCCVIPIKKYWSPCKSIV